MDCFVASRLAMTEKNRKSWSVLKKTYIFARYFENERDFIFNQKLETMSEIAEQIVPLIAEKLGVNPSEVTMEASFTNDLGADSLDTVELMLDFEKKFGITIPDDQQESIVTVGDVVKLIEEHQKNA